MTFNLVFHHPKTKMQKKLVDTRKMENIIYVAHVLIKTHLSIVKFVRAIILIITSDCNLPLNVSARQSLSNATHLPQSPLRDHKICNSEPNSHNNELQWTWHALEPACKLALPFQFLACSSVGI